MRLRIPGRILLATLPATAAVLALTTGTASAMPRDPCQDYANRVDATYQAYQYWTDEMNSAWDAGQTSEAIDDAVIAADFHDEYMNALNAAYDYGCF